MNKERKKAMIKAIHCSKKYKSIYRHDRDLYELMLQEKYNKTSSKQLTMNQLNDLLNFLNENKYDAMKRKIYVLKNMINWEYPDGFSRWLKKRFGFDNDYEKHSYNIIEGLKKVFEHQMKKKYGDHWWILDFQDSEIKRYIHEHCPIQYKGV